MSLTKVPYLVLGVVCTRIIWTPPNPPAKKGEVAVEQVYSGSAMTQIKSIIPLTLLGIELLSISTNALWSYTRNPSLVEVADNFMLNGNVDNLRLSIPFYIGIALLSSGAFLRKTCYSALGKLFTFEVSIKEEHKLITSGPYAYVRHPAYAAFYTAVLGLQLVIWSRGSWVRESGILGNIWGKVVMAACMGGWVADFWVLAERVGKEDELLKEEFGREWEEWAERVPWRLFSGVY